jgi:hypothetical protein
MANKLTAAEFDIRSQILFSYLAFGMPMGAACDLSGLDRETVESKAQRGKALLLKGAEPGEDITFFQSLTKAQYTLQMDALENLRAISDMQVASSWQACRLLLELNHEERTEKDNGMMPQLLAFLNHTEDEND